MKNGKIVKTEYLAVPRENIIEFLTEQGVLEAHGDGTYRISSNITNGRIDPNSHLHKWAYFPLTDEIKENDHE